MESRRRCQIPRRTWVLGTKLESPTRAVKLEHWNISPAPLLFFVRTLYLRDFWSLTMGQEAFSPRTHTSCISASSVTVTSVSCPLPWSQLSSPVKLHSKFSVGLCFDTGSLCVAVQAGLEQLLIALPLLPQCGTTGFSQPSLMLRFVFVNFLPRNSSELIRAPSLNSGAFLLSVPSLNKDFVF